MAKIFVSGGAGVIGTELVNLLLKEGHEILVGDLKHRPDWPEEVQYWEGDLNAITKEELHAFQPEFFYHLAAAFERTEETSEFWDANYRHNIQLSHSLIDKLVDCPSLERTLFASSYLIYDSRQYLFDKQQEKAVPLSERSPMRPRNLCGMAKLQHEQELAFLMKQRGLSAISARVFRVYGKGSKDVISHWVQALKNGHPIPVYGLEARFDYIYAEDVAKGLMRLAATDFCGVVNLGSGKAHTVADVLLQLQTHFPDCQMDLMPTAILLEASEADMSLFKSLTGWMPEVDLEEGIQKILNQSRD